jgi:hypothetical protein
VRSHPRRSALSLAALTTAATLVLAGCSGSGGAGGDDGTAAASGSTSGSASGSGSGSASGSVSGSASPYEDPTASTTVDVPAGVQLTEQGSSLSFGDSARVIFEPTENKGSTLQLTVLNVRKGTLADFKGFILDDSYKKNADYYYARVRVRNVGEGDVGGVPVPLWGVNKSNTLLPAVNFTTTFAKCPSKPLPAKFGPGQTLSTCLVYLSPDRGGLQAVSYRPSQEFNPITWKGTISTPKAKPKKG